MTIQPGYQKGRITVRDEAPRNKHKHRCWNCECVCGTKWVVTQSNLLHGKTESCGCLARERTIIRSTKHGAARVGKVDPVYSIWLVMKDRCFNPDSRGWPGYGARGIRVCSEWQDSFEVFKRDMGPRPSSKHSVERRDNDGNYEPSNCYWGTRKEQNRNRRNTAKVMYKGRLIPLLEACEDAGVSEKSVRSRRRIGWPESDWFLPIDRTLTRHGKKTGRPPKAR